MMKFQLSFAVLLIGVLIAVTEAGVNFGPDDHYEKSKAHDNQNYTQQVNFTGFFSAVINMKPVYYNGGSNATAKSYVQSDEYRKPYLRTSYGMTKIYYRKGENMNVHICNGVHLKAWLVLVPAQCVYERDIKRLYARVIHRQGHKAEYADAKVLDRSYHPKYSPPRSDYNFAMLFIRGKMAWEVEPFNIERERYSTEQILKKGIQTKVDELILNTGNKSDNHYTVRSFNRNVTKDFEVCDELGEAPNWYCADRGASRSKLLKTDIGSPIYYHRTPKDKRLLGMYTGRHSGADMNGHVFEAIYPAIEFIDTYVALRSSPNTYGPEGEQPY